MATCPVRFDFHTDLQGTLKYIHNVPCSLVTPDAEATQRNPEYAKNFVSTIQPIMKEHEAACRTATVPECQSCDSPSVKILQTPMSWLHIVDKPFVSVYVHPVCNKNECEIRVRHQIQNMITEVIEETRIPGVKRIAGEPENSVEILPCKVCGETEKTMRCARCKVVAYCGKEHQKADWKMHKRVCTSFAG